MKSIQRNGFTFKIDSIKNKVNEPKHCHHPSGGRLYCPRPSQCRLMHYLSMRSNETKRRSEHWPDSHSKSTSTYKGSHTRGPSFDTIVISCIGNDGRKESVLESPHTTITRHPTTDSPMYLAFVMFTIDLSVRLHIFCKKNVFLISYLRLITLALPNPIKPLPIRTIARLLNGNAIAYTVLPTMQHNEANRRARL